MQNNICSFQRSFSNGAAMIKPRQLLICFQRESNRETLYCVMQSDCISSHCEMSCRVLLLWTPLGPPLLLTTHTSIVLSIKQGLHGTLFRGYWKAIQIHISCRYISHNITAYWIFVLLGFSKEVFIIITFIHWWFWMHGKKKKQNTVLFMLLTLPS